MAKTKTKRKTTQRKKIISHKDSRLKSSQKKLEKDLAEKAAAKSVKRVEAPSSALFFSYNMSLGPPYRILLDTNFINFSLKNKLDIIPAATSCLLAKSYVYITDCVMAELEKLGSKFRLALK